MKEPEMKKGIVRNKAVFCASSKLFNEGQITFKRVFGNIVISSPKEIYLASLFEEQLCYEDLKLCFDEAAKGKDNYYFSTAFFLDKNHAVRIDDQNNILLYFYCDKFKMDIHWAYPHLITCLGKTHHDLSTMNICRDVKKLSTLGFIFKYFLEISEQTFEIKHTQEGYVINDAFWIVIDEHITLRWLDNKKQLHEKYLSDSWFFSRKEIINDLRTKNILKFGRKYVAFWGR